MAIIESVETQLSRNPKKFAVAQPGKLLRKINGEPPINAGRGKRRNPVISGIYAELLSDRNSWFHVEIPITSKSQLNSIRTSLYTRAYKDNLHMSTTSVFNESTKMYDMWVMLTN